MEKLKTLQRFLCIVSHFSLFYTMRLKKIPKKVNQRKNGPMQNSRTGVSSLCGSDSDLLIHSSQFKQLKLILIIAT